MRSGSCGGDGVRLLLRRSQGGDLAPASKRPSTFKRGHSSARLIGGPLRRSDEPRRGEWRPPSSQFFNQESLTRQRPLSPSLYLSIYLSIYQSIYPSHLVPPPETTTTTKKQVWLQLEEKQIPYVVQKENMRCYGPKTREYLSSVPSGLLPALELDGRLFTESAVIAELLEQAFPDKKPLVPDAAAAPAAAARHAALLRLERRLFGDWLDWLVRGGGGGADFFSTLAVVEDALAAPAAAAGGSNSNANGGNCKPTEGPYFLGNDVSLCDLVFAPFLERIAASIPYYKGVS